MTMIHRTIGIFRLEKSFKIIEINQGIEPHISELLRTPWQVSLQLNKYKHMQEQIFAIIFPYSSCTSVGPDMGRILHMPCHSSVPTWSLACCMVFLSEYLKIKSLVLTGGFLINIWVAFLKLHKLSWQACPLGLILILSTARAQWLVTQTFHLQLI